MKTKHLYTVQYESNALVFIKQGYELKNWVEGLSDEAYYHRESPKKID